MPVVLAGCSGTNSGFTANVVLDVITSINFGSSSGFTSAPTVAFNGAGSGSNVTCTVSVGVITSLTITSGGTGVNTGTELIQELQV